MVVSKIETTTNKHYFKASPPEMISSGIPLERKYSAILASRASIFSRSCLRTRRAVARAAARSAARRRSPAVLMPKACPILIRIRNSSTTSSSRYSPKYTTIFSARVALAPFSSRESIFVSLSTILFSPSASKACFITKAPIAASTFGSLRQDSSEISARFTRTHSNGNSRPLNCPLYLVRKSAIGSQPV